MARHPNPREHAELTGATKKNPQRYRNTPPKSEMPLGDPPKAMVNEAAQACWFELSALSLPGVLTGSDRFMLEVAANLLAEYRENPVDFPTSRVSAYKSTLAELGLSVAARTKLDVGEKEKSNPYENLDA